MYVAHEKKRRNCTSVATYNHEWLDAFSPQMLLAKYYDYSVYSFERRNPSGKTYDLNDIIVENVIPMWRRYFI